MRSAASQIALAAVDPLTKRVLEGASGERFRPAAPAWTEKQRMCAVSGWRPVRVDAVANPNLLTATMAERGCAGPFRLPTTMTTAPIPGGGSPILVRIERAVRLERVAQFD